MAQPTRRELLIALNAAPTLSRRTFLKQTGLAAAAGGAAG